MKGEYTLTPIIGSREVGIFTCTCVYLRKNRGDVCFFSVRGGSFNGMLVTKDLIKDSETDRREGWADRRAEE